METRHYPIFNAVVTTTVKNTKLSAENAILIATHVKISLYLLLFLFLSFFHAQEFQNRKKKSLCDSHLTNLSGWRARCKQQTFATVSSEYFAQRISQGPRRKRYPSILFLSQRVSVKLVKCFRDFLVPFGSRALDEAALQVFGKLGAFVFGYLSFVLEVRLISDNYDDGLLFEGNQRFVEVKKLVETLSVGYGIDKENTICPDHLVLQEALS